MISIELKRYAVEKALLFYQTALERKAHINQTLTYEDGRTRDICSNMGMCSILCRISALKMNIDNDTLFSSTRFIEENFPELLKYKPVDMYSESIGLWYALGNIRPRIVVLKNLQTDLY